MFKMTLKNINISLYQVASVKLEKKWSERNENWKQKSQIKERIKKEESSFWHIHILFFKTISYFFTAKSLTLKDFS